ncbi:PepSY domain-containing protein [Dongia rigui]|uniref:PepSY domain-containing protein n=1 Tax=Dongia rigui TaxID=940149 RepID=A0ABU5DWT2_9PROT|nr:PepSY domain-containing protein [Dongia rigui]MDY0871447.1 PepSY domain-containing protein [Dongia rigui]
MSLETMTHFPITLRLLAVAGVLALPLLASPPPRAFAQAAEDEAGDQEVARKALENKEILPLGAVLAKVEGELTGDVVEIELERKKGQWIYEIEVIGEDGRVRDIDVDAKTGAVINVALDE